MSCHFIQICCNFQKKKKKKKMSSESDFIHFFYDLKHVYSPGAGTDSPRGQSCDVNRKVLSCYPFVESFKEMSLRLILYKILHDLIHVYSPEAVGIQPSGDKNFVVNRNFLSLRSSVASFKSQTTIVSEKKNIVIPISHTKA